MKYTVSKVRFVRLLFCLSAIALFFGCAARLPAIVKQTTAERISKLKFLNEFDLPYNLSFQQTTVGGLSGIDYDPDNDVYYLISDDRSQYNPARFYKAKITVSQAGITDVRITGVSALHQKDGSLYPKLSRGATKTTDPEAMRYNRAAKNLYWTSEGERIIKADDTILIDPAINIVSTTGKYIDTIPLPDNLRMRLTQTGPRRNGVLESITFANDFRNFYVSLEEPLFQDGPRAALTPDNPFVRIYKFDLQSKVNIAQYAYKLEPVPFPATKPNGSINNGIPDILWIGNNKMLITERAYSAGRAGTNIKVFIADLTEADNIIETKSLITRPAAHPVKKQLLLNTDNLGIYIDNIEGATFGPVLPNGHQSILFVADNNFNKAEKAQLLLFEIIP